MNIEKVLPAVIGVVIAATTVVVFAVLSMDDRAQALLETNEYCKMVWEQKHDPTIGWPDYKHIYSQQCEDDHARQAD